MRPKKPGTGFAATTQPATTRHRFDFAMDLKALNAVVGVGWQFADNCLLRIYVCESMPVLADGAGRQREPLDVPMLSQRYMGSWLDSLYLVARVGRWQCSPTIAFWRWCPNFPGLCFPLRDLRKAYRRIIKAVDVQAAMGGLAGAPEVQDGPPSVLGRFEGNMLTLNFGDTVIDLKGKE